MRSRPRNRPSGTNLFIELKHVCRLRRVSLSDAPMYGGPPKISEYQRPFEYLYQHSLPPPPEDLIMIKSLLRYRAGQINGTNLGIECCRMLRQTRSSN
jgi:hypothetical protein